MASVTVRNPGSEDVTIVGKVLDPSLVSPAIPMSIGSVSNADVKPPGNVSVDIPIDNVKDLIKKFEPF